MQLRKAPITLLSLCLTLTSIGSGSFGAQNPSDTGEKTSQVATAEDWFQIGGYLKTSEYLYFYLTIADNLEPTFAKISDLLVKEHCSSETLSALKALVDVCKTLPIKDPEHQWTDEEAQKLWGAEGKLETAIYDDQNKAPESKFFFQLGYETLNLAWVIPLVHSNQERVKQAIGSASKEFAALSANEAYKGVYSNLSPDVVHAMQVVMSVGSEAADPMGDLTEADVSRAVDAGKVILAQAKKHKLLKGA
jgi:hypothetical protein